MSILKYNSCYIVRILWVIQQQNDNTYALITQEYIGLKTNSLKSVYNFFLVCLWQRNDNKLFTHSKNTKNSW